MHGPHLVAVRANTFQQWRMEIEEWTNLSYVAYADSPETRELLQAYQMCYKDEEDRPIQGAVSFNIFLVTYDIFMKDLDQLKCIDS
jgi:hypothetical protein